MKILLFKSVKEETDKPDKFEVALRSENISVEIVPVIDFDFCNLDTLWDKLKGPDNYQGIIFSSPRCVQSIKKAVERVQSLQESSTEDPLESGWVNKWIFCVGPATADVAKEVFENSSKIVTSQDGNAESLGGKIIEILEASSSNGGAETDLALLYPCGNLKRDTLQNMLSTKKIKTDPIVVYETVENPKLSCILSDKRLGLDSSSSSSSSGGSNVHPYVFFSPSGINTVLPYVKDTLIANDRPLIAIGPTTYEALKQVVGSYKNVYQCKSPTPEGLIEVVKSL